MADNTDDIDNTVEDVVEDKGEKGREAKQLNSVTDYHEEKTTIGDDKAKAV